MKVLVCDDEPLFAEGLKQNILNILDKPTWRVSVDCVSDLEQMAKINAEQYDVAFLDIDMTLNELIDDILLEARNN